MHTILELYPEYRSIVTIDLSFDLAVLVILSLLIVQYVRRKHRAFELTVFFQMCFIELLMVITDVIFDISPLILSFNEDNVFSVIFIMFSLPWIIDQIFTVTLLAQWLIYVEYTLHQSRDLIRRRYTAAMVPFAAAVVILIAAIPVTVWAVIKYGTDIPFDPRMVIAIPHAVFIFYIIASYVVLYREKKRNRLPAYIRLTPTSICLVLGYTANLIMTDSPFLPLFFALGLMFADYFMYRRLSGIDPGTGFFNRKYLRGLADYAKKKQLTGVTVIRFRAEHGSDKMASLIRFWEPENCKTVDMGDGVFLLVTEAIKGPVAKRFISLITEQAGSKGIPVEADHETDRERPMDEILEKYI